MVKLLRAATALLGMWLVLGLSAPAPPAKDKKDAKETKEKKETKAPAKEPAKVDDPPHIAALKAVGAALEMEDQTVIGVNFFGSKAKDANLADLQAMILRMQGEAARA